MKVGDLVKYRSEYIKNTAEQQVSRLTRWQLSDVMRQLGLGVVLGVRGKKTYGHAKVLWTDGTYETILLRNMEVTNESR